MAERTLQFGIFIRSKADLHQARQMNKELQNVAESVAKVNRLRQVVPALTGGGLTGLTRGIAGLSEGLVSIGLRAGPQAAVVLGAIGASVGVVIAGFRVLRTVIAGVVRTFQWLGRVAVSALHTIQGLVGNVIARLRMLALVGTAALAAFTYAGTVAVNTYAQFQQAIRNAMTVTGLFGEELRRAETVMGRFARQVAAQSTKTATDVANAFYALASAGLKVNEIMAATPGVIALAEATQSELGMTTELVTSQLRAFGLQATQTNRVVNTLAAAISASPLNMERLAYSLQYVAPVAAQLGMTIEDTVTALGMLAKVGIYASIAGTALKGMLTREEAPAQKAIKILRQYGLTLRDVSVQQIGFANVLRNLYAAGIRYPDLAQIFGMRAAPAVAALLRQGPQEFLKLRQQITGTNFAFRLQALQLQTIQ
ncbi:MAG: phage tail tape measure protein, partial [Armatimonadetes bacterium]|nr:phage tail tape measure protein [Armatimonadota bacterium]